MSRPHPSPGSLRTVHVPVMLREVLDWMQLSDGLIVVDGTIGAGGHSREILTSIQNSGKLIGLDRDQHMLNRAAQVVCGHNVFLHQGSYAQLDFILNERTIPQVDRILLDLGLSSDQLADNERGFGFDVGGGRLDMRFDPAAGESAAELLRRLSASELQQVFEKFGEERQARAIAAAIVEQRRKNQPLETADELANLIARTIRTRGAGESHPAVRVFQALRIAVNQELEQLEVFLRDVAPCRLKAGGRIVILSFHSLEDRIVKQCFREAQLWDILTPKPIVPTPSEIRLNPRSRSAKLRAAARK